MTFLEFFESLLLCVEQWYLVTQEGIQHQGEKQSLPMEEVEEEEEGGGGTTSEENSRRKGGGR